MSLIFVFSTDVHIYINEYYVRIHMHTTHTSCWHLWWKYNLPGKWLRTSGQTLWRLSCEIVTDMKVMQIPKGIFFCVWNFQERSTFKRASVGYIHVLVKDFSTFPLPHIYTHILPSLSAVSKIARLQNQTSTTGDANNKYYF